MSCVGKCRRLEEFDHKLVRLGRIKDMMSGLYRRK
jgi:hypothetical protein